MNVRTTSALPTEQTPAGAHARRLLKTLGPAIRAKDGTATAAWFLAFGDALAAVYSTLERAINQAFANTATDMLSDLESEYGLDVRPDLSAAERQDRLVAKIRAARAGTEQSIIRALSALSVTVIIAGTTCIQANAASDPRLTFRFTIYVTDTAFDSNVTRALIYRIVEQMKPAYTSFQVGTGRPFRFNNAVFGRINRNGLG